MLMSRTKPNATRQLPESLLEDTAFPYRVWVTPAIAGRPNLRTILADIKAFLLWDQAEAATYNRGEYDEETMRPRKQGRFIHTAHDEGRAFIVKPFSGVSVGLWLDEMGVIIGQPEDFPEVPWR